MLETWIFYQILIILFNQLRRQTVRNFNSFEGLVWRQHTISESCVYDAQGQTLHISDVITSDVGELIERDR